jgi:hypothetical protein
MAWGTSHMGMALGPEGGEPAGEKWVTRSLDH